MAKQHDKASSESKKSVAAAKMAAWQLIAINEKAAAHESGSGNAAT